MNRGKQSEQNGCTVCLILGKCALRAASTEPFDPSTDALQHRIPASLPFLASGLRGFGAFSGFRVQGFLWFKAFRAQGFLD